MGATPPRVGHTSSITQYCSNSKKLNPMTSTKEEKGWFGEEEDDEDKGNEEVEEEKLRTPYIEDADWEESESESGGRH